jgi:hypothetical protein
VEVPSVEGPALEYQDGRRARRLTERPWLVFVYGRAGTNLRNRLRNL